MVHPIIDEYYSYNPYHRRSSQFAQDKGLVTNEKGIVNGTTLVTTPGIPTRQTSNLSASLHDTLTSTLTPSMHTISVSPALSPANENIPLRSSPLSDLRNSSFQSTSFRDSSRPQQLGNTKKKRKSLSAIEPPQVIHPVYEPELDSPPPRNYGDPLKIAQYFPELN